MNKELQGWQPIETAPKDGTEVLVKCFRAGMQGIVVAHYMPVAPEDHPPIAQGWYYWNGGMFDHVSNPTHWMPIPGENDFPAINTELTQLREESAWIRRKVGLPEDTPFVKGNGPTLAGRMHNLCFDADGFKKYIEAFKCDDKQGEIARLSVELAKTLDKVKTLENDKEGLMNSITASSKNLRMLWDERDELRLVLSVAKRERDEAQRRMTFSQQEAKGFREDLALTKARAEEAERKLRLKETQSSPEWTLVSVDHPDPHNLYLVRRNGVIFSATPCYGMHEPWWVVKTMKGEADPVAIKPTDEWQPAS